MMCIEIDKSGVHLLRQCIFACPGNSDANARLWLLNHYDWSRSSNKSMGIHSLSDCQVCGAIYTGNTHVVLLLLNHHSAQGLVISLPYCYLNSEVQGVIKTRWQRWKMVRNVEYASTCHLLS